MKPNESLAFEVIEQHIGYERDVDLRSGKFEFIAIDPLHTRIVLTTQYTPLLTPRWAWRPFESLALRTVHQHVIEGMCIRADGSTPDPAIAYQARSKNTN